AVGAGDRHGDEVTALHVGRQVLVLDDDVPALAVLAHHAHHLGGALRRAPGQEAGVVRVVQGGAHVVAHAAVDGDIDAVVGPAEVDVLDRAHRVQGVGGGAGDRSSGLEGQVRNGQLELLALHRDDPGDPLDRKSTRLNSSHVSISYAV